MKVLVVGGGGREHALAWKLAQSPQVRRLYAAPGNPGIGEVAELVPLAATDMEGLLEFAQRERIDLTVVGPEDPLAAGLADTFAARGLAVFGPSRAAAEIESSKAFAKEFMARHAIPTASFATFDRPDEALAHVRRLAAGAGADRPVVVKASGLAAGKGVVIAADLREAEAAIDAIMERRAFGTAGERVVIEEHLEGEEVSALAFVDGERFLTLVSSQDHKRVYDGDRGPNTGGMGAYSPVPAYTYAIADEVSRRVFAPAVAGLAAEGRPYRGVLYAGLMLTGAGVRVVEFNARFGDPEAQVLMARLASDLWEPLWACATGSLKGVELRWKPGWAVCVVLASRGYPDAYQRGLLIEGMEEAAAVRGVTLFHAGTAWRGNHLVTAGGRVLDVTAVGEDLPQALDRAYQAAVAVHFNGVHYRRDIAHRAFFGK